LKFKLGNRLATNTISSSSQNKQEEIQEIMNDITGTKCSFSTNGNLLGLLFKIIQNLFTSIAIAQYKSS